MELLSLPAASETSPFPPRTPALVPQTRAPTHCCRPGAAASPRSCPSGAWQGSPPLEAPGPPGAAPGSGPQRCARRRVNSCYGETGSIRDWGPGPAMPWHPPLSVTLQVPHQCSITTVATSTPFWPPASFSRFSATAPPAASAFRFLPPGAMAPGARPGTEPTWGGNRVNTRPTERPRDTGRPLSELQRAGQSTPLAEQNLCQAEEREAQAHTWSGGGPSRHSHSARRVGGGTVPEQDQTTGAWGRGGRAQQGRGLE